MKTLIAGGGIGGLAAALSIAHHGNHAEVLERSPEFGEIGAGIQLAPNAFHTLDTLGIGRSVQQRAVHIDELRFMDGTTGERVASMPLTGAYRDRFGAPYPVAHRGDLHRELLDACAAHPRVTLRTSSAVVRYAQTAESVAVRTRAGGELVGDALLGADGIRSAVRSQLLGDGPPRISGHTIYRSVIPMEQVPPELRWNTVTLWAGRKWHFVHYPISGGRFLNLAATRDDGAAHVVSGRPVPREQVLNAFTGLSDTAAALLALGRGWKEWVLCDRDPVERWTDGRVALLGDAAHPMLQYAAQGACMALEDAVVLGQRLAGACSDVPGALERFAAERRPRTAAAQQVARAMGEQLYHPAGEAARERNRTLSALSDDELLQKVEWLHGARVATGTPR